MLREKSFIPIIWVLSDSCSHKVVWNNTKTQANDQEVILENGWETIDQLGQLWPDFGLKNVSLFL